MMKYLSLILLVVAVVESGPVVQQQHLPYTEDEVVRMRLAGHNERAISRALSLHAASPAYAFTAPNGHLTGKEAAQSALYATADGYHFALVPHQEALREKQAQRARADTRPSTLVQIISSLLGMGAGARPTDADLEESAAWSKGLRPRWVVGP